MDRSKNRQTDAPTTRQTKRLRTSRDHERQLGELKVQGFVPLSGENILGSRVGQLFEENVFGFEGLDMLWKQWEK